MVILHSKFKASLVPREERRGARKVKKRVGAGRGKRRKRWLLYAESDKRP